VEVRYAYHKADEARPQRKWDANRCPDCSGASWPDQIPALALSGSEADRRSQAGDPSGYDPRRKAELRTGQTVDRRNPAGVQGVEHLEIQLDLPPGTGGKLLGHPHSDDLNRRRGEFAVLSHAQSHRA